MRLRLLQALVRARHRPQVPPPIISVFLSIRNQGIVFSPILDPPDRIPPVRFSLGRFSSSGGYSLLDCRHGLVLVYDRARKEAVVCDPITSEQRCVAIPSELRRGHHKGAVLCAAGDHGHVNGSRRFNSCKLVLLSTGRSDTPCLACVYSLETGVWGNLIATEAPCGRLYYYYGVPATPGPATVVGNCLYWLMGYRIIEFDLDKQNLAVFMGPPCPGAILDENHQIIQAVDGAVGYAILSYPCFEMWQRNIDCHGIATWVPWKTVEMHTILQLPSPSRKWVHLLGYDEDDVVFLCYEGSAYMVQLKSMQSRKFNGICPPGVRYYTFKSFFTPGTGIAGGFNAAELLHMG